MPVRFTNQAPLQLSGRPSLNTLLRDYLCEWSQQPSWSRLPPNLWRSELESRISVRWGAERSYPLYQHVFDESQRNTEEKSHLQKCRSITMANLTTQAQSHNTWTGVLITSNGTGFQNFLSSSSISSFTAQVQQDQMVVRTTYRQRDGTQQKLLNEKFHSARRC